MEDTDIVFEFDDNSKVIISKNMGKTYFTPQTPDMFINTANEHYKYELISYTKDELTKEASKDKENNTTVVKITMVCGQLKKTFTLSEGLSFEQLEKINTHNTIAKKKISKDEAKKLINKKYNIGDILLLRGKYKDGSKRNEKVFEVKKVIWSLKGQIVNALILKQLEGSNFNMSLTKKDCVKYHVKYEPGLQVYSMNMDFKKRKNNCE